VAIARRDVAVTLVNAATTSWVVTMPTHQSGDVLVVAMLQESNTPVSASSATGTWTNSARIVGGGSDSTLDVWWMLADSAAEALTFTLNSAQRGPIIAASYSGVDQTTSWDVNPTTSAIGVVASPWTLNAANNTVTANCMILSYHGFDASAAATGYYTSATPLTIHTQDEDTGSSVHLGAADGIQAAAGATSATWAGGATDAQGYATFIGALRPAAGGGAVTVMQLAALGVG
jgi:hypothetical protein